MKTEEKAKVKDVNHCPNCGYELFEKSKFCANCGVQISNTLYSQTSTPMVKQTFNRKSIVLKRIFSNRNLAVVSVLFVIVLFLTLIQTHIICIYHSWDAPTCIEPAQCIYCEKYKDDMLGNHDFITYNGEPQRKCRYCNLDEGELFYSSEELTME